MSDSSLKGVVYFVLGGFVLFLIQFGFERYLANEPKIVWGMYEPFERLTPNTGDKVSFFILENSGDATANNVEIFLRRAPSVVFVGDTIPHSVSERDNSFVLTINSVPPNETYSFYLESILSEHVSSVAHDGEIVKPSVVDGPSFAELNDSRFDLLAVALLSVLAGVGAFFAGYFQSRHKVARDRLDTFLAEQKAQQEEFERIFMNVSANRAQSVNRDDIEN